jgi:hypothetical protein
MSKLLGVRLGGEAQWTQGGVQRVGGGWAHLLQGLEVMRGRICWWMLLPVWEGVHRPWGT